LLVGAQRFHQGIGIAVQQAATPDGRGPPGVDRVPRCGLVHRFHHGPSQIRTFPVEGQPDQVRPDANELGWDPEQWARPGCLKDGQRLGIALHLKKQGTRPDHDINRLQDRGAGVRHHPHPTAASPTTSEPFDRS
jgi:hypothetical protein